MFKKSLGLAFVSFIALSTNAHAQLEWPVITQQAKPWARWWWEGSAVNEKDLSDVLHLYKDAGLGGLEITPIYGVKGEEADNILFLSKKWMQVFDYTLKEGKKLDLGMDLANATGWPFGGPWVTDADASKSMEFKQYTLQKGESIQEPITFIQKALVRGEHRPAVDISLIKDPISLNSSADLQKWALDQVRFPVKLPLICLMAYDEKGRQTDLTSLVDKTGHLNWKAPADGYRLYAVFQGLHGKMVERAAPGGEGFVIDHFSAAAVDHYLAHFDSAFNGDALDGLRGFFNDSYEVDDAAGEADFTPKLFGEFKAMHGYDLKQYLPLLLDKDNETEQASRVLSDYRETIGDLLLRHFTEKWQHWGKSKEKLIRNQSHGSPANILDLYAAVDIPETEGTDKLRFKFASSAANVTGKTLTSSESATWLKDHFLSSLADVKKAIDLYFLGGVNHIFYHGVAYSPVNAVWPGWLFYAAVHFQPTNPQWHNFSKLNEYIARCQSFLQNSEADNDVLQYFPIYDSYASRGRSLLKHYDGMKGFEGTAFKSNAEWMLNNGYSFDFISDRQIGQLSFDDDGIKTAGGHYQTILVSAVTYMPERTLEKILQLVRAGATVLVYDHLPESVNGLGRQAGRQKKFDNLIQSLRFATSKRGIQKASLGKGTVLLSNDLAALLAAGKIRKETISDQTGLQFIRRKQGNGHYYFIDNRSDSAFEGWVSLQAIKKGAASYALFSPMRHSSGIARTRDINGKKMVLLQLRPWESIIIQASTAPVRGAGYVYTEKLADPIPLKGTWKLSFKSGGPVLPKAVTMSQLQYWSTLSDTNALNFSGTADYTLEFKKPIPDNSAKWWRLDMGDVKENAEVFLNGQKLATLIGPDFTLDIDDNLLKKNNQITIRVSNLMANRIHYMDRSGLNYKMFYNINFPAHEAENRGRDGLFTTINWDVKPSGLTGPVTLTPIGPKP
ncbi:glycosyl hydrolase [Arachidicoccus terrestris]|uniref:glycosyl hydrolase n=1 Tax=Arachidicoccus terrestris TaxID=2875539 RepID=UPI001CC3DE1E|nr:glycosyl hydrolase [Arachidicoccus terrestris]